jgi:sulfite exporter TauE/SafE
MAGFQKYLSIGAGTLIIISVILFSLGNQQKPTVFNSWLISYTSKIKGLFKKLFGLRSRLTLLSIGIVNGLLPCGFVYIALAGAIAAESYFMSTFYMLLFGLGTVPTMLSLSLFGNLIGIKFRNNISKATPYIAVVVALFLIYRGYMIHQQDCCHHN